MILRIYLVILVYFLLGGIVVHVVNLKKDPQHTHKNWVKFITYFFIIQVLFLSITINPLIFRYLAILIIVTGCWELLSLYRRRGYSKSSFFWVFLAIYLLCSLGFLSFSRLHKELMLFTVLVLSFFDAFSQLSGQLFGKNKIFSKVSPGKTWEGLAGGIIIAILSSLLISELAGIYQDRIFLLSAGIVVFGFIGDFGASYYKRQYQVKDFSNLLPGHGGFLDRFDSLITGGAFVGILQFLNF